MMTAKYELDFGFPSLNDDKEPDTKTLNGYQMKASATAIYPSAYAITYPALGLAGEAGEVANKVKKMVRDGTLDRSGIASELGDCLWYIAALARDINIDLCDIALENLAKLNKRKEDGTLKGSGDNR